MRQRHMSFYVISLMALMLLPITLMSQTDTTIPQDSIVYKEKYGLRIGADISKLIKSFIDEDYKGFEINGDYRLTKRVYLAGELGTEEKTNTTDYLNVTTKGSYFKAGLDYNSYQNWLDMQNMIYGGFRVGISSFNHTLNSYTVYNTDQYWDAPFTSNESQSFNGLTAIWAELIIGAKAEIINNLYLGLNVQIKGRIIDDKPENFGNLYIPGFNKVYDSGRFGIGFGYNISYLIPIYKKNK